jgi:hypothetical protein
MCYFKSPWRACAGAIWLALLASSAHADTTLQEFTAAWQQWKAAGIHDYAFTFTNQCFCMGLQPVRISVKDDVVQSAYHLQDGAAVTGAEMGNLPSMAGIFQKIEQGYAKPADHITLTLNQDYGYPERVFIDYVAMMADEELVYEIRDFTH